MPPTFLSEQQWRRKFALSWDEEAARDDADVPDLYVGLSQEAFATPFVDYAQMFHDLDDQSVMADLGAGYARGSFVFQELARRSSKDVRCISLEVDLPRITKAIELANSLNFETQDFIAFDLLKQNVPLVQAYYIYLPLGPLIFKTLSYLLRQKRSCLLYVTESHGDVIDFFLSLGRWTKHLSTLESCAIRHRPGIYKFLFSPCEIAAVKENSYEMIYWILQNYGGEKKLRLVKESGEYAIDFDDLLPLYYANEMRFESIMHKRIIDFCHVKLFKG